MALTLEFVISDASAYGTLRADYKPSFKSVLFILILKLNNYWCMIARFL
jgi:hypothetical protein